jgi:hypothetical protein
LTAGERTKGSAPNGSMHYQNSVSSWFPPESNFDLLLSFPDSSNVNIYVLASFEVFTVLTIKDAVFWDITPCDSCMNSHFTRMYCHHHQVTTVELGAVLAVTSNWSTLWFLSPSRWRWYVPTKNWFLQELHGVMSQKTAFFIVVTVETSNLV